MWGGAYAFLVTKACKGNRRKPSKEDCDTSGSRPPQTGNRTVRLFCVESGKAASFHHARSTHFDTDALSQLILTLTDAGPAKTEGSGASPEAKPQLSLVFHASTNRRASPPRRTLVFRAERKNLS